LVSEDSKILLGALVIVALVVCAFVWITGNGLGSQIGDVKTQVLKNADAIAQIKVGGGVTPSTAPGASPTPALPKGISMIEGGASCATGGKPQVLFFTDPYCPACAATEQYVNAFVDKFASVANVTYKTVITHSGGLIQKYGEDNITIAHEYFLCVQDQGLDKIQKFKELFYAGLKNDGSDYIPFTEAQLVDLAREAGADGSKIASCLLGAKARVDADVQEALTYGGGTYSTPTMVLDCLYTGHAGYAQNAVCFAYPNLAPCKA
jgi:protein-disulfide isomerase